MQHLAHIPAPPGWGHLPGANLLPSGHPELPELPMLRMLPDGMLTKVIREAVESVPGLLHKLTCRDLMDKYGIGRSLAYYILQNSGRRS